MIASTVQTGTNVGKFDSFIFESKPYMSGPRGKPPLWKKLHIFRISAEFCIR